LPPASLGFAAAVMERLALEAPVFAQPAPVPAPEQAVAPAANDDVYRWKLVAGVATLAAAVAVVWQLTAGAPALSGSGAQLAQGGVAAPQGATRVTAVITERGVLLRDPDLDALLAAHRQQGGVSALQMPAGFLRDATYEVSTR
jgi:sigma-E factor negative regulatory protein RseA